MAGISDALRSDTTSASSSKGGGGIGGRRRVMSLVEDLGPYNSTCGYCKSTNSSKAQAGLWAHSLSVGDYQDLLDRGWRRSGMFLYKPCMKETCCPPYTIRLKVGSFVPAKDQIRVLRRMQRYLDGTYNGVHTGGEHHEEEKDDTNERASGLHGGTTLASSSDRILHEREQDVVEPREISVEKLLIGGLKHAIQASVTKCVENGVFPRTLEMPEIIVKPISHKVKSRLQNMESDANYTSNIAFSLAAAMKRKRKAELQDTELLEMQQGNAPELKPQEIAENLACVLSELAVPGVLLVKACRGHLNISASEVNTSSANPLVENRQVSQCQVDQKGDIATSKPMETTLPGNVRQLEVRPVARSSFDAEEYALYRKYQIGVHDDRPEDVKESSYRKFLVDSPLTFVPPANDGTTPSCGFGSFHQQYRIDGKLVAVGVVDILPYCLSSKYLFWDPDYAFLSLGKYSALQEIQWVQQEQKKCASLQYYYLGFYIHSCPKMRYKASYYPSELLCPERYRWVSYELARPLLEMQDYCRLSDAETTAIGPHGAIFSGTAREQQKDGAVLREERSEASENITEGNVDDDAAKNGIDISAVVGDIQLYLRGTLLPFKHFCAIRAIPRHRVDGLASSLLRYTQDVGPSLATRMAYVLP